MSFFGKIDDAVFGREIAVAVASRTPNWMLGRTNLQPMVVTMSHAGDFFCRVNTVKC